ncbi:MAG TPA: BACON domain-containing carbohydrate-binding protein [Blastocatellia bacterium]|nr:BACON domain-containing carbohydrate-binding protein [Blastocatellia bacterium]
MLIGRSNGFILRTDSALTANSFTNWLATQPRSGFVSWVTIDPANANIAYATYSTFGGTHVWRTIDGGATWTGLDGSGSNSIPDLPVHCLVVDPVNTARLYVGTDLSVFVSTDGGANWAVENTGFARVVTESLSLNAANGVTSLYAFTHGRGAFRVTLNMSGCNHSISPATRSFSREGGDAVVNVTVAPDGCTWRAESNALWITVAPGSGGATSGTVALKVAANNTIGSRAGTVTIAGRSFSVIQEGQPDDQAPAIVITSPATPTVTTTAGVLNVSGTASDNVRVSSVVWRTDRGATGTASGTTTWAAAGIPLAAGRNLITFTASDSTGNISTANLTVSSTPASLLTTIAGNGLAGFSGDNGAAQAASLSRPIRLAYDGAGNLYFADFNNHRVRRVAPNGIITTIAGNGVAGFSGDGGPATQAQLNFPLGVAIDRDGSLYITEQNNHRVRKVTAATGVITTIAGSGALGSSGDGGPATAAAMNEPRGLVFDKAGNAYIADTRNNRIRRVTTDGHISTFAGTGRDDFGGDGGPAKDAFLSFPLGLALDAAGNLYIGDSGNSRIRRVSASDGVITTVAGNGFVGFDGDGGPARDATLNSPAGVAVDGAGNIYFVDQGNARVRRVNAADGRISTIAGIGVHGYNGDGIPATEAQLNQPRLLSVDAAGDLYIADQSNNRIRRVTISTGLIITVAGTGAAGPAGDGGSAPAAQLAVPTDVQPDGQGNLYIADGGNQKIRRTVPASSFSTVASVLAASFNAATGLAPESISAAFGPKLAAARQSAMAIPLPQVLGGATLKVKDALGVERLSPLFYADTGQINFEVPQGTASGVATITVTAGDGTTSTGTATISPVAPGIFAANADGQGPAAVLILRVRADNSTSFEPVAQPDPAMSRFVTRPIDLGPETDRVFLILYGTGIRFRSSLQAVTCQIGGTSAEMLFADKAPGFVGLDQINVGPLPRSLSGKGEVDVVLTVDGKAANTVRINIR